MNEIPVDAKIVAAEARTDAELAKLRGELRLANAEISAKLDRVLSKVDHFDTRLSEHKTDLDRRLSEQRADLDRRRSEQKADLDRRLSEQAADLHARLSDHKADLDRRHAEQKADFDKGLSEHRADLKADFRAERILIVGTAFSLAALMVALTVAVFGVGGTMFSRGIQMRDLVRAVIAEQQASSASAHRQ